MSALRKICMLLSLISCQASAQFKTDSTEHYLLNFSVPDMPAFKALGADPSNLLRPSDIQKFALSLSPFYSNSPGVIPRNFAVEFSPGKLTSKNWTLEDYGKRKFWYNSSFSIGAIVDSGNVSSKLAIGYRFSIVRKKDDLLLNAAKRRAVFVAQQQAQLALREFKNNWIIIVHKEVPPAERAQYGVEHDKEFWDFAENKAEAYLKENPDTALQASYDAFKKGYDTDKKKYYAAVDDLIEKFKSEHWNATRLDGAIAWVGQSRDSLIKNTGFASFNTWLTWALGIGKSSQLLLGGSFSLPRSEFKDSTFINATVNVRYYLGTSGFRGFAETQFKYQNYDNLERSLLFNFGTEFRVAKSIWIVAEAGIDNYLKEKDPFSAFIASINLRYGFNQVMK
ncbi:hypothetical protein MRBLMN1_004645 [Chitinophaga ginsengisegetis]|uniref:hypothetical protein n=1 Tax=Chitinophaga ginsengisegetis TaxID=393003 RepID=UPI00343E588D